NNAANTVSAKIESGHDFWLISGEVIIAEKAFAFNPSSSENLKRPLILTAEKKLIPAAISQAAYLIFCPNIIWPALIGSWKTGQIEDESWLIAWFLNQYSARFDEIAEDWLIKINSAADRKKAIPTLLQTARKPQDGFIARHFNRRISLFFTRYLAPLKISPTFLSILNFLIGLSAAVLCGLGKNYFYFLAGAFLFEFSSIFDGCDGEVARLTYQTSEKGGLADVIFDALTYILFFSALAVGLYRSRQNIIFLWLLGLFLGSISWYYFNLYHFSKSSGIGNKIFLVAKEVEAQGKKSQNVSLIDRLAAKLAFALRRDFFATMVFLIIALNLSSFLLFLVVIGSLMESTYVHFFRNRQVKTNYPENQANLDLT
ncbi:MAG: CDP-alcohol phosphatidyltransferase family protein, partial [Candidatus Saccharicenans sp.]